MADIVEALAECLETLRRGGDLATCLERYPRQRAQLEALLRVAALIRPLPVDVVPSQVFRETTRRRILRSHVGWRRYPAGEDPAGTS